jgi:predicted 2-oxoglutarate/Fe(II)-dependent dioxygenase YbiX
MFLEDLSAYHVPADCIPKLPAEFLLKQKRTSPIMVMRELIPREEALQVAIQVKDFLATNQAAHATVYNNGRSFEDLSHRRTHSLPLHFAQPLIDKYQSRLDTWLKDSWDLRTITPTHSWGLYGYAPGYYFRPHFDLGTTGAGPGEFVIHYPQRKLTVLYYFSDCVANPILPHEFSGGEFRLNQLLNENGDPLEIQPRAGDCVAFQCWHLHEAAETTGGYRIMAVNWLDAS